MFIFDDLLIWLARKLQETANLEVNDESKLKEELMKIRTLFETDQMSEEELTKQEEEILKKLGALREAKEGARNDY